MKKIWLLSATMLFVPDAAYASETDDAGPAARDIIVIARADGYAAPRSSTATKTDTRLLDVPQSVQVVTREKLDDQAQHSMSEVLRYVPGTTVGQGEGNRDQITLRGQNTTADFFLDGVRDDVQYYRSLYNVERVEILKGPSALIFGRGGGGGVINRVQKTPSLAALSGRGMASANTFGAWDLEFDINAPLSRNAALRLNADYERLDNFRDFFGGERYAFNPAGLIEQGRWKLGLSYEYVSDDRVVDRGIPSIATAPGQPNRPITGYRNTFFGTPGVNRTGLQAHIGKARLDAELGARLNWSTTLLYGDYDKYYTNVFANGPASAQTGTVRLSSYSDATRRRNFIAQTNLVWNVEVGPVRNTVLIGGEYGDQRTTSLRRNGTLSNDTLNLSAIAYPTATFATIARNAQSTVRFASAYVQDQIGLGRHVNLVLGVRYDRFEISGTDRTTTPRPFARTDETVSPRLGLILKPRDTISLYGSVSRSFLPRSGEQFVALSTIQANLTPERFTNYEIGAKWDIRPDLNATLALFQLDRTNATTPDPNNVATTINIGATRTEGVELALAGRLLPGWQVNGGYTYQDARLRRNAAVRLAQVPRHQFALWNRYDVDKTIGVGLGVIHQSSQFAAIRTLPETTRLPAFTRVDAALFVKVNKALELQVNIENLLDTRYFSDAHNNNNITPGAPINARFTARMRF